MKNNQLQTVQGKPKFSVAIQSNTYKDLINRTLGDEKRANRFIAAISSAVGTNPALQECDAGSILTAALLGEALNLSPSPQLGHYFCVPYNVKVKVKDENGNEKDIWVKKAQFQLGYKGYVQLAIRSGQYTKINVLELKEGELKKWDPMTETIEAIIIEDEEAREKARTAGYYAMFELTNGFTKTIYWSKEKMEKHALKYSQGYQADKKKGTNYTFWSKDFDGMALKTMLRQLISKWGIMSTELQEAYDKDSAVLKEDGTYEYVDNTEMIIEAPIVQDEEVSAEVVAENTAENINSTAEVSIDDL